MDDIKKKLANGWLSHASSHRYKKRHMHGATYGLQIARLAHRLQPVVKDAQANETGIKAQKG